MEAQGTKMFESKRYMFLLAEREQENEWNSEAAYKEMSL